jgi:DNA recombination protein RmuC
MAEAAAQAQFESLESQFQALECAHSELKTAQSQLQERHLVESTLRATAQATAALVPELQNKLEEAGARAAEQAGQIATLQAEMLAGERAIKEQRELLDQSQVALANSFKALSADALNSNNQAFLQLARSTFETIQEGAKGDLQARQVAMDQLVQPIRCGARQNQSTFAQQN